MPHLFLTLIACFVFAACAVLESYTSYSSAPPRPQIIFDTDFGGDADDLGALAMLHHYTDAGKIDLLAIASWSHETYVAEALAAVNTFYGRPELPVGIRDVAAWRTDWNYTKILADTFPYEMASVSNTQPAISLYRELLAAAKPHSITIITVGPLANIRNLLRSAPDDFSGLTGAELVSAKVERLVIMGGQFPEGITAQGPEWNFNGNMKGVTQEVLATLDRPIIFSGYEVGAALKYGSELNAHPPHTPLYTGYKYFSAHAPWMQQDYKGHILDNASYDQTAVLFAALGGVGTYWDLSPPGRLSVDENGVGSWARDPRGPHRYLILKAPVDAVLQEMARAMTE